MNGQQHNRRSADFERGTATSSITRDGARVRSAMNMDSQQQRRTYGDDAADARRQESAGTGAARTRNSTIYAASYAPTRQGKRIATILVIGVALFAGAMIYALRSSTGLFHKKEGVAVSSESPAAVTDRIDSVVPEELTATRPRQQPEPMATTTSPANTSAATATTSVPRQNNAAATASPSGGRIEELEPEPQPVARPSVAGATGTAAKPSMEFPTQQPVIAETAADKDPTKSNGKTPTRTAKRNPSRTATGHGGSTAPGKSGTPQPGIDDQMQVKAIAKLPAAANATPKSTAPKPKDGKSAAAKAAASKNMTFSVQVGATADKAEADRMVRQLKAKRIAKAVVERSVHNGKTLYRVRFGSFTTNDAAKAAAGRSGHGGAWIIKHAAVPAGKATVKNETKKNEVPKSTTKKYAQTW